MPTVKEKPIWKFNVTGHQTSKTQSVAQARGKSVVIDEPIQRGGTDEGPMPVEYVFMGLVGCTHVISNKLAEANGITFTAMDIDINVTMDSHGTRLIHPIDIPFPSVTLNIKAEYDGPRDGAIARDQVLERALCGRDDAAAVGHRSDRKLDAERRSHLTHQGFMHVPAPHHTHQDSAAC